MNRLHHSCTVVWLSTIRRWRANVWGSTTSMKLLFSKNNAINMLKTMNIEARNAATFLSAVNYAITMPKITEQIPISNRYRPASTGLNVTCSFPIP